jgi:probable rRNA maturation factor
LIYLSNSTRRHAVGGRALVRDARKLLVALGEPDSSVSIALVGDAAIRRLNRMHRGRDRATDVLSFSALDRPRTKRGPKGPERAIGDVVISLDRAARQARDYDGTLERELRRLLIHGLLHLLGHDHQTTRERGRMVREEHRLAAAIGLRWPYGETPRRGRAG